MISLNSYRSAVERRKKKSDRLLYKQHRKSSQWVRSENGSLRLDQTRDVPDITFSSSEKKEIHHINGHNFTQREKLKERMTNRREGTVNQSTFNSITK